MANNSNLRQEEEKQQSKWNALCYSKSFFLKTFQAIDSMYIYPQKNTSHSMAWWCMRLVPAFGRQKQVDLCDFEASLIQSGSIWIRLLHRETLFQNTKQNHHHYHPPKKGCFTHIGIDETLRNLKIHFKFKCLSLKLMKHMETKTP